MDDLIKFLINENFLEIENIMLLSKIQIGDYQKCLHYIIYQYIHNNLSDKCMFAILYLMVHKFNMLNVTDIYNIQYLIDWHKNNNYVKRYTYNFFNLHNSLLIIENKLTHAMNLYKLIRKGIFGNLTINSLDNFRDIMQNKVFPVICSFDDNFLNYPITDPDSQAYESYVIIQTEEMINRLKMLVKYFGLDILNMVGIKIISSDDFLFMEFSERTQYYKLCLNKMIISIVSIERYYQIRKKMISDIDNFNCYYELLKNKIDTNFEITV